MNDIHRSFYVPIISCLFAGLVGLPALAADESPWSEDVRSAVRLIAGSNKTGAPTLRAGIEIKLDPGWKTYWRYPGDSGVPPRFDFAGSQNVKSVEVVWPAPHRFSDESGITIGYKDNVVFPLRIVPQNTARPVLLRLKADYAVCEKVCIPVEGRAELLLDGRRSELDSTLAAFEALVPKRAQVGDAAPLAVRAVRRERSGDRPRVIVDVAAPAG